MSAPALFQGPAARSHASQSMTPPGPPSQSERVLVLMPTARDAERTLFLLDEAKVSSQACSDLAELCHESRLGAGALLVTDDVLLGDSFGQLAEALREQPSWSAVPVLVVAQEGAGSSVQNLAGEVFDNLIVVERPVRTRSLASVVLSALRARRHQYQMQELLRVREQQAAELLKQGEWLRHALTALQQSQAELARQAEELRGADRRKDEFLATLAHELRNPLAPIRTAMELLTRSPDSETAARALDVMQRQVAHMVRLLDDLLDVSRITRGKLELKRERTSVTAIIATAVEASRPLMEKHGHTLRVNVKDADLHFQADLTRLAQVISNLLNNACNYTSAGGLIDLIVEREGDHALIRVRDDGFGIPPEHLEDVFQMFSQVNRTLERSQGGLGIGLALARSLVEMHGGSVAAASPGPGLGSTFTIRLPLGPAALAEKAPAGQDGEVPTPDTTARVLVVDDNQDAADLLAMMLESCGYVTLAVYDGAAALAAVEAWRPHVVVLDVGLPGMSGYDVARQLRQQPQLEQLGVIALTGWGSHGDKQRAMEAGFDAHLTKPVETRTLRDAITRLVPKTHGVVTRAAL